MTDINQLISERSTSNFNLIKTVPRPLTFVVGWGTCYLSFLLRF